MKSNHRLSTLNHLPNALTMLNLVSGSVAVGFAFHHQLQIAALLMMLAALFDFFDGFFARMLHVSGELGKQLDSLADMISFGLLPGAISFSMIYTLCTQAIALPNATIIVILCAPALLIPVFSALRLGKFNIDQRQKTGFIGLPTPANALLWASLGWSFVSRPFYFNHPFVFLAIIIVLIGICCYLLTSEIPMFGLKFTDFSWNSNKLRYSFLITATLLILVFRIEGIGPAVILYIAVSITAFRMALK
jgi:CDP-diacylglycerol--serine O-phosphatidyltransferase